jgi:hypothetical protein
MNKKIILIISVIIAIILAAGCVAYLMIRNNNGQNENISPEQKTLDDLELACENSGGIVISAMCCAQTENFPNLCLIGACGCAPDFSHQVEICDCGPSKCFNGSGCVPN